MIVNTPLGEREVPDVLARYMTLPASSEDIPDVPIYQYGNAVYHWFENEDGKMVTRITPLKKGEIRHDLKQYTPIREKLNARKLNAAAEVE